jgi:DNA polymerase III delta subunit
MIKVFVGKNNIKGAEELKWEALRTDELLSLSSTESMFGGAQVFLLVGALNSERQEEFLDIAKELADSPHTFIFEEEKLLKTPTVVLEKAGAHIEITKKAAVKERGFDPFGLTAALGAHDKKKLWLNLTAALAGGEKAEAIAGLLAWKVRQMNDPKLSRTLTFMYHDSHRGAGSLELLLEKFALTL